MDKQEAIAEIERIESEARYLADPRTGIKELAALVHRLIAEGVAPEAAE